MTTILIQRHGRKWVLQYDTVYRILTRKNLKSILRHRFGLRVAEVKVLLDTEKSLFKVA